MSLSNAAFAVLLGAVVIDSLNKSVRVVENGVAATLSLVEGTYYLRGNGAADDLVEAFRAMLESHSGTNTYSASMVINISPTSAPSVVLSFTRATGTHTFQMLFANAATTFDAALIGFTQVDTGTATSFGNSALLTPTPIWVANDIYRSLEPVPSWERKRSRALSGKVRAISRRSEIRDRLWVQENIHEQRMHEEAITTDPARALNRFLQRQAGGLRFELDEVATTDVVVGQVTDMTKLSVVGTYVFDDDFYPLQATRMDGAPLYDFQGHLLPYVA